MRWLLLIALAGCGSSAPPTAPPVVANDAPPTSPEVAAAPVGPPGDVARGEELFGSQGCMACHSIDGANRIGVSMKGLWGTEVTLVDGTTHVVDREYIRGALAEPSRYVQAGYPAGAMPSYRGQLSSEQMDDLVAYIASLK